MSSEAGHTGGLAELKKYMYLDTNSVYVLFIVIAAFWLLFVTVFSIYMLLGDRSDQKISKGFEQLRKDLEVRTGELLQDTKNRSAQVVNDAIVKGDSIENEAKNVLDNNHQQFKEQLDILSKKQLDLLQSTSTELLQAYKVSLQSNQQMLIASSGQLAEKVKSELLVDFDKFKEDLNSKTLQSQKELDTKVEESYKNMIKDIESYKNERIQKLNDNLSEVLKDVANKAFGKVITLQEHKDFVLKALEDSKKEHGLK